MDIGLVLALLSATSFAMATILLRRGMAGSGESFSAVVITLFTSMLIFSLTTVFTGDWYKIWSLSWRVLALLTGAGILQSAAGRLFLIVSGLSEVIKLPPLPEQVSFMRSS